MTCVRSMTFYSILINFKFLSSQRGGKGEKRSIGKHIDSEKKTKTHEDHF